MRKIRRKANKLNDGTADELVHALWNEKDRAVADMQAEPEHTGLHAYHKGRIQGLIYAITLVSCWNDTKIALKGLTDGTARKAMASLIECSQEGSGHVQGDAQGGHG